MEEEYFNKTWNKWSSFQNEFTEYFNNTYQVSATLDSRTVERQNARLSENSTKYSPQLQYT